MTPADRQLLEELRAAVAKKTDLVERQELEQKLALIERGFATESTLTADATEGEALLAKGRRAVFWGRLAIGILVIAVLGTMAWFWGQALHLF